MTEICQTCADTLTKPRDQEEGMCGPCRKRQARDIIDFCLWCGQPIWRRGRTCSPEFRDNLRIIVRIEHDKWTDEEIADRREPVGYMESRRNTIEDIIEAKLREDHSDTLAVIPELYGMSVWSP